MISPFERTVTADTISQIPPDCLCTWVPTPSWLSWNIMLNGRRFDPRQPWLTKGWALKFSNNYCPAQRQHR